MANNRRFEDESKASGLGVRHLQCFLLFCGLCAAFGTRVNLSVAIVAMTDKNAVNPDFPEYNWSERTKSVIMSSFFWGYVITQIPGGHLAVRFGGKILILCAISISSVLSILLPLCANIDWKLFLVARFIQGLSQGATLPSVHAVLSKWAPPEERGILGACCYSGTTFGTVVMLGVSGVLASSPLGWPSTFYIPGCVGLVWSILWYIWGASSPNEYGTVSEEEIKLIEASLGQTVQNGQNKSKLKTPWSKIFTSVPFYVLMTVHCADNWGFWTMLTQIPSYMKSMLNMDIKSNALLSALPYLVMFALSFAFSAISSVLNRRKCIALTVSRKLFNTIGQWVPCVSLVCLGYLSAEQANLAVVLLTITVGINSATGLGYVMNHIDLSPNFAGILMGFTNCAANIMSVLAPLVVGLVVTDETNPDQWRIIFFIAAGFYFVGNTFFICFGKTKSQPWNDAPQSIASA